MHLVRRLGHTSSKCRSRSAGSRSREQSVQGSSLHVERMCCAIWSLARNSAHSGHLYLWQKKKSVSFSPRVQNIFLFSTHFVCFFGRMHVCCWISASLFSRALGEINCASTLQSPAHHLSRPFVFNDEHGVYLIPYDVVKYLIKLSPTPVSPSRSVAGCGGAGGGPSLISRDGVRDEARLTPDGKDTLNWWCGDGAAIRSTKGNGRVSGQCGYHENCEHINSHPHVLRPQTLTFRRRL